MLASSRDRILATVPADAPILDVGGWAHPFSRADWVLDLMPYETRGLYGEPDPNAERFTSATWVVRDVCAREPWPFDDGQFDFAVCSHTLEDVRDPVWVCSELNRVAKAGYIEVPARVEEQTLGVHGRWVGWSHHHWLVDIKGDHVQFVFKPHLLQGNREFCINLDYTTALPLERRVETLFWEGAFSYGERFFFDPEDLHSYLADLVAAEGQAARVEDSPGGRAPRGWRPGLRRRG